MEIGIIINQTLARLRAARISNERFIGLWCVVTESFGLLVRTGDAFKTAAFLRLVPC